MTSINDLQKASKMYREFIYFTDKTGPIVKEYRNMRDCISYLPVNVVWCGWKKWAMESNTPDLNLNFLNHTMWVDLYSPLSKLTMEDDLFEETKLLVRIVADKSKNRRRDMFLALCWNFGRALTQKAIYYNTGLKDKKYSKNYHLVGAKAARMFLLDIGAPPNIRSSVVRILNYQNYNMDTSYVRIKSIINSIGIDDFNTIRFMIMNSNSIYSLISRNKKEKIDNIVEKVKQELKARNILNGNDLIEMGLKPDPIFKTILADVHEAVKRGDITTKEEARTHVVDTYMVTT